MKGPCQRRKSIAATAPAPVSCATPRLQGSAVSLQQFAVLARQIFPLQPLPCDFHITPGCVVALATALGRATECKAQHPRQPAHGTQARAVSAFLHPQKRQSKAPGKSGRFACCVPADPRRSVARQSAVSVQWRGAVVGRLQTPNHRHSSFRTGTPQPRRCRWPCARWEPSPLRLPS